MTAKTYMEYLATCKGQREVYFFDSQEQADTFGEKLRKNLCKELGCGYYELDEFLEVKISRLTVRIKATENSYELVEN